MTPQDLGGRRLLLQGLLFSDGTSRYLVPQCLIGGSELRGAHFHPTIQFRMRSTQIFLDRFSHRDIGTECQAWNADADQEHKDKKK